MLLVALTAGVLVGVSLGALGGGGSILTVPALVYLLGMAPHEATAGSLLVVGVTAAAGLAAHARRRRVRWGQGLAFGVLGTAGAVLGTRLSAALDPHALLAAFAGLLLVAAAGMAVRQWHEARGGRPPDDRGAQVSRWSLARVIRVLVAATAVGLLTGFFGVGGGFLVVPALVLALNLDMPTAVGTSLLVIAINSAVALATRLGTPVRLEWPVLLAFAATAVAGGLVGGGLASRVAPRTLAVAFTLLLVAVAGYTCVRTLPHLV